MLARLAVFWDFAQLHDNLLFDQADGRPPAHLPATTPQPEVVDLACLLRSLDQSGAIVFNRAYADWRPFGDYAGQLTSLALDLTQLFPNEQGTINVHRRLTADLLDYIGQPQAAETIVIVGGGSEYRQLRQIVKQNGRKLLGVGIEGITDNFWIETCDDFRFYHRMGCSKLFTGEIGGSPDFKRARDLLTVSMQQLASYYGSPWVQQVRIKPAIIRRDPDFDEGVLGYDAFSQFLRDQNDLLERRHREGEQEPEYRLRGTHADAPVDQAALQPSKEHMASQYLRIAGQQGIRMPDPVVMWEGIDVYASFLVDGISFESFAEIDQECLRLLREDFPKLSMTEVKKVRQVLFKCFLFRPSVDDTIGFHEDVSSLEDIEDRYFQLMLARIGNNADSPLNYAALSLALTGSEEQADRLASLDEEE